MMNNTQLQEIDPQTLRQWLEDNSVTLVVVGTVLGAVVSLAFLLLSGFVGAGLVFAGITNTCAMGMLLTKLPYNQQSGRSWR